MDTLARSLLACLICTAVYAESQTSLESFYKLRLTHTINMEPYFGQSKLRQVYYFNWTELSYNESVSIYLLYIDSMLIYIQDANSTEKTVHWCSTLKRNTEEVWRKPFYVIYRNGLFEGLHVPVNYDPLSVNRILQLCLYMQVESTRALALSEDKSLSIEELTMTGLCNVTYDVLKGSLLNTTNYGVSKTFDMNSCSNTTNTPINVCNSNCDKHYTRYFKEGLTLTHMDQMNLFIQHGIWEEEIHYNPWKSFPSALNYKLRGTLNWIGAKDTETKKIDLTGYELVKGPIYQDVNTTFLDVHSQNLIQKTYSALACDSYNLNVPMTLYNRVYDCL